MYCIVMMERREIWGQGTGTLTQVVRSFHESAVWSSLLLQIKYENTKGADRDFLYYL